MGYFSDRTTRRWINLAKGQVTTGSYWRLDISAIGDNMTDKGDYIFNLVKNELNCLTLFMMENIMKCLSIFVETIKSLQNRFPYATRLLSG